MYQISRKEFKNDGREPFKRFVLSIFFLLQAILNGLD